MRKLLFALIAAVTICGCGIGSWKSPDGKSEKEILEIGYKSGYEWGYSLGVYGIQGDGWEQLKEAAKSDYFGEIVTREDNRVFQKFKDELYRGLQDGIRDNEKQRRK